MKDHLYILVLWFIEAWLLLKGLVIRINIKRITAHIRRKFAKADISFIDVFDQQDQVKKVIKTNNGSISSSPNPKVSQNPWDIVVYNKDFYRRIARDNSLGLGEAYMEGWWDCEKLDEFFTKFLGAGVYKSVARPMDSFIHYLQFDLFNLQTVQRVFEVGVKHYDLGNKFYESFLDPTLNYSCAYWQNAKNLNEAQQHKMELIGRKLKLEPGMRVLDLGCGFGGLAKFLAETYKVSVVGCTISVEQGKLAQERCAGLPVDIRVVDYREIDEKFDRVVSVGILEHVGHHNYGTFFKVVDRCLIDHGIFLLHCIGVDNNLVPDIEPWFHRYIFPNGVLPHHTQIPKEVDNIFTIEDWHNFGNDYNKTCMAWYHNFVDRWPTIKHLVEEPESFYRMWTYYLLSSAGGFRCRKYQLWQVILSKNGVMGGYVSVR